MTAEGAPASVPARAAAVALLAGISALLLAAILVRPGLELRDVFSEGYPRLEAAQAWLWLFILAAAAGAATMQHCCRGLFLLIWLGFIALLAGLREMDLHVVLNPGNVHLLGLAPEQAVRFRADWWLSGDTSIALRLIWGTVLALLGAAVFVPFVLARYPWPRRLREGAAFPWLIVGGFSCLGFAFLLDDAIGRPLRKRGIVGLGLAEELVEFVGEFLILSAVALLAAGRVNLGLPANAPRSALQAPPPQA